MGGLNVKGKVASVSKNTSEIFPIREWTGRKPKLHHPEPGAGHTQPSAPDYEELRMTEGGGNLKPASHAALDAEQEKVQSQLFQAVELINQADGLLRKNTRSDIANSGATALLLSAVARTLVIQTAEHFNMLDRIPACGFPK